MRTYQVTLDEEELQLISNICHNFKDCYRGCREEIIPVMAMEANIRIQTDGAYEPDPTYDIKIVER